MNEYLGKRKSSDLVEGLALLLDDFFNKTLPGQETLPLTET